MILLHGESQAASRNFLNQEIEKATIQKQSVVRFDGRILTPTELIQAVEGDLLFQEEKLIVIEGLFSAPKSNRQKQLIDYLKKTSAKVIVWEPKKIDGRRLSAIPKTNQRLFALSPAIWAFLDGIRPKNQKATLTNFHRSLKTEPAQKIFFYLALRIRDLLLVSQLGSAGLSKKAGWQAKRLQDQANQFEPKTLQKIYDNLFRIDLAQKTGQSALPLESQLDLLLTTF